MISTVEVIEKSKAISDIGLEIQTLNNAYAKSCVCDADEHDDAVEAIAADYIEGAMRAFEILNG